MSKEDLLNLLPNPFLKRFEEQLPFCTIINIYMVDGELVKIGSGSKVKKESILKITSDFITIQYDSHETDYLISNIKKIEYY